MRRSSAKGLGDSRRSPSSVWQDGGPTAAVGQAGRMPQSRRVDSASTAKRFSASPVIGPNGSFKPRSPRARGFRNGRVLDRGRPPGGPAKGGADLDPPKSRGECSSPNRGLWDIRLEASGRRGSGNMKRTPHHLARPSLSLGACLPRARSTAAVNPPPCPMRSEPEGRIDSNVR